MIQRLSTGFMPPDELRQMIGEEAYLAALKLTEQDEEQDQLDKIYDKYHQVFGDELRAERSEAQWKLTMAYEEFGVEKRALLAEKAKLEQEKKTEQEKATQLLKLEKEKAKKEQAFLLKVEKEKAKKEQTLLLKVEKEKAKKEKRDLLKAEKEKQEQLLKAEKEKQEQLLKAEKEKEHISRLKMVWKMLDKGNSVETIADLLEVSVLQVQEWIKTFQK
jgi:hypothetical protein